VSASNPNLFCCRLIAVVIAGREVLMVRKRHTGLWDLPGGDLSVGEHPETGIRRIVESDSSTVVAITGLVGIYSRSTPRLALVFGATPVVGPIRPGPDVIECDWVDVDQVDRILPASAAQYVTDAFLPAASKPVVGCLGIPTPTR
jgi:ADP-ribose pyrophosphatase YjhB (NUDIX family)